MCHIYGIKVLIKRSDEVFTTQSNCIDGCLMTEDLTDRDRLQGLEKKILIEAGETPAVVYEMKKQVDSFREKLEVRPKYSVILKLPVKFVE